MDPKGTMGPKGRLGFLARRLTAFALAMAVVLPLAACGKEPTSGNVTQKEWVYVPEFLNLEEENVSYYDMKIAGNNVYYTSWVLNEETGEGSESFCRYSLTDRKMEEVPLNWKEKQENESVRSFSLGNDGSIYVMTYSYNLTPGSQDEYQTRQALYRFDAQGNQIFCTDLTEKLSENPENSYVNSMEVDAQGRLYVCTETAVWLYDGEGNYQGEISLASVADGWINGMGCGRDGKVYLNCYSQGANYGYMLVELDFDGKKTGATYSDFPRSNGNSIIPGVTKDFLVYDEASVYEYDLATQTKELLFDWLDSDMNGSVVRNIGLLEDGRFVVIYEDWESDDNGIALLTKTKGSEVVQRENILIGTMYGASDLRAAAVKFNKGNDKYRISIKEYMDTENVEDYESALNDAIANMNNDLTSKNGPDIIDLSGVNIRQLAAKGVFEDLSPYLEKSSVLNRADFLENILEAYTYSDSLVCIPAHIMVSTLAGDGAELGGKKGWTVAEMIQYADAHPDAELFDGLSKSTMMMYLMMFNEDAFIDWTNGKCNFESDQFKSLLEFVNRFPEDIDYDSDRPSTPNLIQRGEVLLDTVGMSDFEAVQIPIEEFKGNAAFIGFPTVDGSTGHALNANELYAISAKSGHKEGAWAFIESYLTREENGRYWYGFPTIQRKLDAMIADATKVETYIDENGNEAVSSGTSSISYQDGWRYTYHTTTQEEVDIVLALLKEAKPVSYNYGSEIINIINEEAEPYYKGQKSIDEVVKVIQSRIDIYVNQNQ